MAKSLVPKIEQSTYINAPIERVYRTLTTADGWNAWFTKGTTLELVPGGKIHFRWVNFGAERMTTEDGGPVLEVEENRKFVFQWHPGKSATTVAIKLSKLGKGTLVQLEEFGYPMDDLEVSLGCAVGWGEALTLLKFFLESGNVYGEVPAS